MSTFKQLTIEPTKEHHSKSLRQTKQQQKKETINQTITSSPEKNLSRKLWRNNLFRNYTYLSNSHNK